MDVSNHFQDLEPSQPYVSSHEDNPRVDGYTAAAVVVLMTRFAKSFAIAPTQPNPTPPLPVNRPTRSSGRASSPQSSSGQSVTTKGPTRASLRRRSTTLRATGAQPRQNVRLIQRAAKLGARRRRRVTTRSGPGHLACPTRRLAFTTRLRACWLTTVLCWARRWLARGALARASLSWKRLARRSWGTSITRRVDAIAKVRAPIRTGFSMLFVQQLRRIHNRSQNTYEYPRGVITAFYTAFCMGARFTSTSHCCYVGHLIICSLL